MSFINARYLSLSLYFRGTDGIFINTIEIIKVD